MKSPGSEVFVLLSLRAVESVHVTELGGCGGTGRWLVLSFRIPDNSQEAIRSI
jgi:hypothetical protein